MLVVRGGQVVRRVHALDAVAERRAPTLHRHVHGEHHPHSSALPVRGEHGLGHRVLGGTESPHPSQVMDAVHHRGGYTPLRAVPPTSRHLREACFSIPRLTGTTP